MFADMRLLFLKGNVENERKTTSTVEQLSFWEVKPDKYPLKDWDGGSQQKDLPAR